MNGMWLQYYMTNEHYVIGEVQQKHGQRCNGPVFIEEFIFNTRQQSLFNPIENPFKKGASHNEYAV